VNPFDCGFAALRTLCFCGGSTVFFGKQSQTVWHTLRGRAKRQPEAEIEKAIEAASRSGKKQKKGVTGKITTSNP